MGLYDILVYLHVLAFAVWLGGGLGVAVLNNAIFARGKSIDTRLEIVRLYHLLQMGPRMAWVVTLPLSLSLVDLAGYWDVPTWGLRFVWLVSVLWFGLIWAIYGAKNPTIVARLKEIEQGLKLVCAAFFGIIGLTSTLGWGPLFDAWLALKAFTFSALFAAAFFRDQSAQSMDQWVMDLTERRTDWAIEQPLRRALRKVGFWSWTCLILVFIAGFLGTVKPG
ncbi:hypothetical protein [Candidatus Phycosocius spiralis]|uniref:Copper resistance protein D domain-containing protein n=1 Tax=Candidatus Phycosocius spiralis TaxID=2815099 RepID=A0ABQ4PTK4_9PROT|nr:hypothetical protein [Candidatus Phycosocius spiralis]GIU66323.1 hypothetical protein PsB1_0477 [Candidatus Phycosocius spiralis]